MLYNNTGESSQLFQHALELPPKALAEGSPRQDPSEQMGGGLDTRPDRKTPVDTSGVPHSLCLISAHPQESRLSLLLNPFSIWKSEILKKV